MGPVVAKVGEVKSGKVATQTEGGLVISQGSLLSSVEGAEPKTGAVLGQADLSDPFAPVALPHTPVKLVRFWGGGRRGPGGLHGLSPRAKIRRMPGRRNMGLNMLLVLEVELGLNLVNLGRAEVVEPERGGGREGRVIIIDGRGGLRGVDRGRVEGGEGGGERGEGRGGDVGGGGRVRGKGERRGGGGGGGGGEYRRAIIQVYSCCHFCLLKGLKKKKLFFFGFFCGFFFRIKIKKLVLKVKDLSLVLTKIKEQALS